MSGTVLRMFPIFGGARLRRRRRASKGVRWSRDTVFVLTEILLLLGSLALLYAGSIQKWPATYPVTLSIAAAAVAMMHVILVKRTRTPSPAERLAESAPMLDFSQAVRTARSVEGLYQSLIGMVGATFPSKAVSLFVRDDDTGHYSCRISTAVPIHKSGNGGAPTLTSDAFVVRRLRGLDSPMQLEPGDLKVWVEALRDAPKEVFEKRMREKDTLEKTGSSLLVQLKTRNDLVGVLCLGESTIGRFSTKDQEVLKGVAGQLALIIENAKLLERMVEHQRLQAELALAAEVQRSLLPVAAPKIDGYDLCGFCKPAQQVGGDYYDFIPLGENCTGIAVADVAGKGISAALLMSVVQASLRGQLLNTSGLSSIHDLVTMLNRLISGSVSFARYVTFFYAQLTCDDGVIRFVNAGHNPPMLFSSGSVTAKSNGFEMLSCGGPVLGVIANAPFQEGETRMTVGDVLVAYTDGVTEATNVDQEEFGDDRLRTAIAESAHGTARDVLDHVMREITKWSLGTPQHDDITVVVLKKGQPA